MVRANSVLSWQRHLVAAAFLALAACGLAACAVTFVSPYDATIDQGLTSLNTDLSAFVAKMARLAGKPAGTYQANQDFYEREAAVIDSLVLRAEAQGVSSSCPGTGSTAQALRAAYGAAGVPAEVTESAVTSLPSGDCLTVLLRLIRQNFANLETFHKAQEDKGIVKEALGPILVGGLGASIRAAMTVEIRLRSVNKGG